MILDGITIVDASQGIAGPFATRLLAEAGADVVKVEPPGGDRMRTLDPSGFAIWNRSKRGAVLDLEDAADRERLGALLAGADVFVHDCTPARAAQLGLDDARLAVEHPDLVVAVVTGYPHDHSAAEELDEDLLVLARLGVLDEVVDPADDPIYLRLPIASLGAAYQLALGIVARLDLRARTGDAGLVRTSLFQGALAVFQAIWNRAEHPVPALGPGGIRGIALVPGTECSDGEWVVQGVADIPALREAIAALDPPGDADGLTARQRALRSRPAAEWVRAFGEAEQQCMQILRPGEGLRYPQVVVNGYAVEVDDPALGPTVQPGPPIGLQPPCRVTGPAPTLDPTRPLPPTRPGAVAGTARRDDPNAATRGPLTGLKVLDLGMFRAGPYGPQALADLGADVVKLEAHTGDRMRGMAQLFVGCQRNKRSVAVNLKDPEARPILEQLVQWADVVHHNLRRPAALALGVDEASIHAIDPDVVFCHVSTYGPEGEMSDWPGVDHNGIAASGWMWEDAGVDNPPLYHPWGWADHLCALSSALATMLAVHHQRRTGEATSVTASLLGASMNATDRVLLADGSVSDAPIVDHQRKGTTPGHRLHRCADAWLAVAADRNGSVDALLAVAGVASVEDLDGAFAERDAAQVREALRAAGVPAEVVREDQRLPFLDDPENQRLRLAVTSPHQTWGALETPGVYYDFGDLDVRIDLAPPGLGEHSVEVLGELGYGEEQIVRWVDAGVVTDGR